MNKKLVALVTATYLGSFMATLDISIVNVALPAIQHSIGASIAGMQWIINAYAVFLAAFILAAGGLSQRYGLKRVWLFGMALFTLSSFLCSMSNNLIVLLIGRALQGIGGAIIIPGTLSIIFQSVTDVKLRSRIVGGWSTCTATALIIGPTLGGILVDYMGWQSIFIINIPIGLTAFLLGLWGIRTIIGQKTQSADLCGQVLSTLCISCLIYAMIEVGNSHDITSLSIILPLVFSVLFMIMFIIVERHKKEPLIPLILFKSTSFTLSNIASLILGFSYYSSLFFFSLFFQQAQGLNATQAGLRMMPIFLFTALLSLLFGKLNTKITTKNIMVIAYGLIGIAMLALSMINQDTSYPIICMILIVIGIGTGLAVPATSVRVLSLVPAEYVATASSIMNSLRQAGMALGIAILGSIMSIVAVCSATKALQSMNIGNAKSTANALLLASNSADTIYREAIATGFQYAMCIAGIPCVLIALSIYWDKKWIRLIKH